MEVRVHIEGADRLLAAFSRMPAVVRREVRVGVKEAAGIVQREARTTHRFQPRTARLERSVEVAPQGDDSAVVFLNEAVAGYGRFVHQGSGPHMIRPSRRRSLRWTQGGRFAFAKAVRHPGSPSDPFLYDAADRMRPAVQARLQAAVDMAIASAGLGE